MRVQHEAITIGRKCIVTKNVVLYNKECGKCPVSVEGGVLMCYVSSVGWKVSWGDVRVGCGVARSQKPAAVMTMAVAVGGNKE